MNQVEVKQLVDEAVRAGVATGLARRKVSEAIASASVGEAVEVGLAVRARAARSPWGRLLEGVDLAVPVPVPAAVQRVTTSQTPPGPPVPVQAPPRRLHEMDAAELAASGKTVLTEVLAITEVTSAAGQIRETAAKYPSVEPGAFVGKSPTEVDALLDALGIPRR